ncbi:MAG: 2-dehydro-3-deoxygalactonokinase [Hyphomonas sp.]|uniref:2-dehydro-3-deoxygalactonokinase n=1 Tax=Hyphomonas sp. TaxID=87 RepID=UPI003527CB6D
MMDRTVLIGVDWGSSSFRAWAFDDEGDVVGATQLLDGLLTHPGDPMARLKFNLTEWLGEWPEVPIIACGAIGSAEGIHRTDYLPVPLVLADLAQHLVEVNGLHIVPGLKQMSPPDVMRGEETQLFALEEAHGWICLPGTHTKHVTMEHGRVVGFTTEMTGELRALLLGNGGLKPPAGVDQVFDEQVFREWVERSLDTEDAASPFAVRAARMTGQLDPAHHTAALSGLLIGADIAAHYDPGDELTLVADGPLLDAYRMAFATLGAEVDEYSAEEATQDGLFELADEAGLLG